MITAEELSAIVPNAKDRIALVVQPLNEAMFTYGISDTPIREAAFIAQVAHESGSFRYVKEIASGEAYEGRQDLGNVERGDGVRFKGRGYIQVTGRANYKACGEALGIDLLQHPELLEDIPNACRSAAWFWYIKGLNDLADKGDFLGVTKRINGGTNGYKERMAFFDRAKLLLVG
jgi:putative chitinase